MCNSSEITVKEMSIDELLTRHNFKIPCFQRHYQWTIKNVKELWLDLLHVKEKVEKLDKCFSYRLGSIILYQKPNTELFEIVDGQQRIVTLYLLYNLINKSLEKDGSELLRTVWSNDKIGDSKKNISINYKYLEQCIEDHSYWLLELLKINIKVIVFTVKDLDTAFQLFDSQNSRGKDLSPHDLLKPYHLREMSLDPIEKMYSKEISEKWDSLSSLSEKKGIMNLHNFFNDYLFRIYLWSHRLDTRDFTKDDIYIYKGASSETSREYAYIKKLKAAGINFQLTDHCISGRMFFEKVFYYHKMLSYLIQNKNDKWLINKEEIKGYLYDSSFKKVKNLYFVTLLLYFDKFSNLHDEAVNAIFDWIAFLRIKRKALRKNHIDEYANERKGLFQIILDATDHLDITNCCPEIESKIKSEEEKINKPENQSKEYCWELREKLIKITVDNGFEWPNQNKDDQNVQSDKQR